jgi:hypothetical protein
MPPVYKITRARKKTMANSMNVVKIHDTVSEDSLRPIVRMSCKQTIRAAFQECKPCSIHTEKLPLSLNHIFCRTEDDMSKMSAKKKHICMA